MQYWSLGCLTSGQEEEGVGVCAMAWRTQAEDSVGRDSSMATRGCATGFALKVASGVSWKGSEK